MQVSSRPRFPREVFILRGPPGIGKSDYAMQQLATMVEGDTSEEAVLAARLCHVCAVDDFCMRVRPDGIEYKFQSKKLEVIHAKNEARVRLAMEAGIHPLFVDCPNLNVLEMRPYVNLADRLGYVVTVVEPGQINERWKDVSFLLNANDTTARQRTGNVLSRRMLELMIKAFKPLTVDES